MLLKCHGSVTPFHNTSSGILYKSFPALIFKQYAEIEQTAASLQFQMSSCIQLNTTVDVMMWIPTRLSEQLLEELLVVDAGHTADLCYLGLSGRVSVDKVCSDANSQLASQLLVLET